jgi:cholest-4-en-3-one 26-monooxygenase
MSAVTPISLADVQLIDPDFYVTHGYPHDAWTLLRRHAPVYWFDRFAGDPFWAITKYDDIVQISRQPDLFPSSVRNIISPERDRPEDRLPLKMILNMDPPEHGAYRRLVSKRFTPRALRLRAEDIEHIAQDVVDSLGEPGAEGECDFVDRVAAPVPIAVIAWILGVPREDWRRLFDWTNQSIGAGDPEYRREGETPADTGRRAQQELFLYFHQLLQQKRERPGDDLISALVQSRLDDGNALPDLDLLAYYFLIVVAGNETTRNATSGGLMALAEHPEQWEWLKRNPHRIETAVEEIVRWVTPVIHFARTAARDTEIRGQKIRAGETVAMFYASANRDEDVFPDGFSFRLDREPNRHLGFGVGEHFCLGSHVARVELQVIFRYLAARVDRFEVVGEPSRLRSSLVGGVKHLPIRYRLRA